VEAWLHAGEVEPVNASGGVTGGQPDCRREVVIVRVRATQDGMQVTRRWRWMPALDGTCAHVSEGEMGLDQNGP